MSNLRDAMPGAAAVVDAMRRMLGAELVDQAIATGVRLQREHAWRVGEVGQARADAWLAQQQPRGACFQVIEGGRQVGVIPRRCSPVLARGRR